MNKDKGACNYCAMYDCHSQKCVDKQLQAKEKECERLKEALVACDMGCQEIVVLIRSMQPKSAERIATKLYKKAKQALKGE
jgi:hypothetical protein